MRAPVFLFAIAACAGSAAPADHSQPTRTAATPSPPSAPGPAAAVTLSAADVDGAAAAATAKQYLRAVAAKSWSDVCVTRASSDRKELARLAGTCEAAMSGSLKDQPVSLFQTAEIGARRRRGDIIALDVVQPGQTAPVTTLLAAHEGSEWLLVDLPDDQSF